MGAPSHLTAERRPIGAEAEEGRMAEAHEAADADEKLQAEGEEREDQDLGRDLQEIGVRHQRQAGESATMTTSSDDVRPCACGLRLAMPTAWVPPTISGRPKKP